MSIRTDVKPHEVRFEPIQQARAHEYVTDQIRRHIALRLLHVGDSLPSERELATMFGVGRPTVQIALRLLEADGLLEARRGRGGGTFILEPPGDAVSSPELGLRLLADSDAINELVVYRQALEPGIGRLAAAVASADAIASMRASIAGMKRAESKPTFMRLDTEFHVAVAMSTGNRYLTAQTEFIRIQLNAVMSALPDTETWNRGLIQEHDAILAAIEAGDADAAQRAEAIHIANGARSIRAVLSLIQRSTTPASSAGQVSRSSTTPLPRRR